MTSTELDCQKLSGTQWRFTAPLILVLIPCQFVFADAVYDNLDAPGRGAGGFWNADHQVLSAQSFQLGQQDTVESVTLRLRRDGQPDGMLSLDLYDDNNGKPGSLVGSLGILDPLSLAHGDGDYIFETPVSDLTAESTYHLVFSHDGVNWGDPGRRVFWSLTRTPGQPGAGEAMFVDPLFGVKDWHNIHGSPLGGPPFSVWFYAHVQATLGQWSDADFDRDGVFTAADIDLLSAELRTPPGDSRFDINSDGQVNLDDHRDWVHDSKIGNTYFGDANLDGEFNSGDLIAVFQAGEYEDPITLNSTWAEGDWTGDGEFDSGDLVSAFQDGGYELGKRAAVSAVPEPSSAALLVLGMTIICCRRRPPSA